MKTDNILKNISRFTKLTAEEEHEFCSLLTFRTIKKRQFLCHQGDICQYENYVNKGLFRNYIVDKQGMEHNYYFASEDWWTSDVYSRTFNTPAFCNIVAVEDSEVVQIHQNTLDNFMVKCPKLEHFFRVIYQKSTAIQQFQLLQHLQLPGEDRYKAFRSKYPEFDQRIAQKHIASYLGMTPEHFNIVRSKVIRAS